MDTLRAATVKRCTKETDIAVGLCLDGTGVADIDTNIGFFDHMLDAFTRHSLFDLSIDLKGDLEVDAHHSVEDAGIVIGQALREALGDKIGINRYGSAIVSMDEALILCAIDISGRGALVWDVDIPIESISTFDTQLAKEFFIALATNSGMTLHLHEISGENSHHLIEACFKACARALRNAVEIDLRAQDSLPSTKGMI